MAVVTWVLEYARIVQTIGALWIGLRLKFPLIWLEVEEYHLDYHLCDYEEESWPHQLMAIHGFRAPDEDTTSAYNFTDFNQRYSRRCWDSAWGHVVASVKGRCWV